MENPIENILLNKNIYINKFIRKLLVLFIFYNKFAYIISFIKI